jgi:large subunit ribosomal protein L23
MAILGKKTESAEETKYEVAAPGAKQVQVPTVLVMPRISEKSGHLLKLNKYVFKVKTNANKVEVKKAVENTYKVKVTQVNMVNNQSKARNFGSRSGKTQAFKKAIVTLKVGDKIEGLTDVV